MGSCHNKCETAPKCDSGLFNMSDATIPFRSCLTFLMSQYHLGAFTILVAQPHSEALSYF